MGFPDLSSWITTTVKHLLDFGLQQSDTTMVSFILSIHLYPGDAKQSVITILLLRKIPLDHGVTLIS